MRATYTPAPDSLVHKVIERLEVASGTLTPAQIEARFKVPRSSIGNSLKAGVEHGALVKATLGRRNVHYHLPGFDIATLQQQQDDDSGDAGTAEPAEPKPARKPYAGIVTKPKASKRGAAGRAAALAKKKKRAAAATADAPRANDVQHGGTHYKTLGTEPWDYIAANSLGFFEGNAIKYLSRWRGKGGLVDLHKARHYIDKLIEVEQAKEGAAS